MRDDPDRVRGRLWAQNRDRIRGGAWPVEPALQRRDVPVDGRALNRMRPGPCGLFTQVCPEFATRQ